MSFLDDFVVHVSVQAYLPNLVVDSVTKSRPPLEKETVMLRFGVK